VAFDWQIRRAAVVLRRGGVIANATEAVIGLAARAADRDAGQRIRQLKRRPRAKPFIVVAADLAQLDKLVSLETPQLDCILASWPGPHTWVLPARPTAPRWLVSKTHDIAVRVTAHPQMAALCRVVGPLVSTSANPAGRRPARTLLAARGYFSGDVDLYLQGALGASARPTTIRDGRSGELIRL
jgi:L-threonylcarbamoyladenylate synthase